MADSRNSGKGRLYADIHRLLATLMQRDIADPRLAGISITRVEAVHGGQQVRVMVHKPGEEGEKTMCIERLNQLASHFAHQLRHAMPKRRLPGLKFCWDESIDGAANVTRLLNNMEFGDD
ncbi:MAG: ribosome-binding factor A [Zetaproteobacteria bacterium CG06_land_8_20_14_3_00_59_53]|nr:MAG: ribosome-binding factor A [Zetaproteobacteria bacterium CG2_30_59_37]PIO90413.1 MAG: ribosome-binding factor A [Zetaproteobacteria bacterium CG23_combo_of_CG06-09_8_20_14_all_59_86]PIQ64743.1 MAG: ribosome-binding factor A [Zetaproteobacteria bacterium CG11_big_fil_rev_8_21_14_0_20_59_439]PIU71363.1 MAG: ribosome-binding factor A [Zetaproteobacteria bacterium CG06_land_8_20_14_3_00_59_53]PIU97546.1 MAG: ribosome-binding factor A [Zetaproteobacteria bacterium CG03_land_8_20_14_0_80_59_51